MTTSAVGLVVDENDVGIADLNVVIEDVSQQFDVLLDSQATKAAMVTLAGGVLIAAPSTPGR